MFAFPLKRSVSASTAAPDNIAPRASKTVSLFSQPFLDTLDQCYKNIVVINLLPQGPLAEYVRYVSFPALSQFKQPGPCNNIRQCGYALQSLDTDNNHCVGCGGGGGSRGKKGGRDLMTIDEIPNLISFLISNGYSVDTSITKMFQTSEIRFNTDMNQKLICFVTYTTAACDAGNNK